MTSVCRDRDQPYFNEEIHPFSEPVSSLTGSWGCSLPYPVTVGRRQRTYTLDKSIRRDSINKIFVGYREMQDLWRLGSWFNDDCSVAAFPLARNCADCFCDHKFCWNKHFEKLVFIKERFLLLKEVGFFRCVKLNEALKGSDSYGNALLGRSWRPLCSAASQLIKSCGCHVELLDPLEAPLENHQPSVAPPTCKGARRSTAWWRYLRLLW